jgi:hypothetical protein
MRYSKRRPFGDPAFCLVVHMKPLKSQWQWPFKVQNTAMMSKD